MPAKKKSEVASVKKELRRQWVFWYRGSICAELKKKPRSQSELFIGLARRDGRPNPQTRCHPSLMPPPAATALEELIREKVVERERSERLIMFRLSGKPAPLVRKPRFELRRPSVRTVPAVNKAGRAERWKDRRDCASEKSAKKFSEKLVSLGAQVRQLSRQIRVSGRERARCEGVVGRTIQELGSKLASMEEQVRDLLEIGKGLDDISSRLDALEQRLGVFEEQVGRVARSVKAVIAEPRPVASEADGGA